MIVHVGGLVGETLTKSHTNTHKYTQVVQVLLHRLCNIIDNIHNNHNYNVYHHYCFYYYHMYQYNVFEKWYYYDYAVSYEHPGPQILQSTPKYSNHDPGANVRWMSCLSTMMINILVQISDKKNTDTDTE